MLNREKHQLVMGQILREIYTNVSIAPLFGFKGGTCAYFFYGLPRFSVDLDFDLFPTSEEAQNLVFETIKKILEEHGEIKDSHVKRNTIFFLLSYGRADHNIKVEVNMRTGIPNIQEHYELKEYLGISMFVGKKGYLFASKLAAFTSRSETAMRDIYDIWYFGKNNWNIDVEVLRVRTNKTAAEHLTDCVTLVEQVKDNEILQGLGELINERDKIWVKNNLRKEAVFVLKNYISVLTTAERLNS